MFKGLSNKMVADAVHLDIISEDNVENSIYGLNSFLTTAFNVITSIAVGVLTNMLFEITLFLVAFKLLRRYAGGAHEKTAMRCYISSFITYATVLLAIKYYSLPSILTTILVFISSAILYITSPVETLNKPLDDLERRVFRYRSRVTIVVFSVIYILIHYMPIHMMYYSSNIIAISIFVVTVFAIEGIIRNCLPKPLRE